MRVAVIEVPLGPRPAALDDCPRHVDVQLRTPAHRVAMRRLYEGLDLARAGRGERLASGERVTNNVEAILWLLEQIHGEEKDREEAAGRAEP